MDLDHLGPDARKRVKEILGYCNYSSGAQDLKFLRALDLVFGKIASAGKRTPEQGTWQVLRRVLEAGLEEVRGRDEAFRQVDQAESVVRLVFDVVLPGYREHHHDLLFHQTEESLFQPFFIGRVCEAVLLEGGPWEQSDRILRGAIARLNDFIGHRPVAVLRTEQKIQPYAHERVRPIPLYIRGAGVAAGRYHDVVHEALEILRAADKDLLDLAWFDPDLLDELAVDPRAYDFDHPVNRRPNYQFGMWDPHHLDRRGYYRRYVVQEVTLEALWSRVQERGGLPYEEVLFEAGAVLAGTILMGSGITGDRPDAHDSSVSLSTLLPHVAAYRDAFYERLLERLGGAQGGRLHAEAETLRQPFGGARQHLNQSLALRRARQLQHVHLALLFAQMGYPEEAVRQAQVVPVASARMRCEIDCRITAAHLAIDRRELAEAAERLPEIEDLLHRAIECGAMIDPWNILGFGGQFSKFPAVEDSVHDERLDDLIDLMNEVFLLYARLQREATAAGHEDLFKRLSHRQAALARWWDQFASTEVSEVAGFSGRQAWESADQVAAALGVWHRAGTASADIAFWREHAEQFRSPEAFALLVEALLEHRDLVAAMSLLVHWLSQAEEIPLAEGGYSFHALALRWMENLWSPPERAPIETEPAAPSPLPPEQRWALARKFLDYIEANAESFWQVPRLELGLQPADSEDAEETEETDESSAADSDELFSAAYENVIYRDTTDDGFESETLEWGEQPTDFELSYEAERINDRLAFLNTVARLWKLAAAASANLRDGVPDRDEALGGWLSQATERRRRLRDLMASVYRYSIPPPRGTHDALVEFDRRRQIKEALLDRLVAASVETADAARMVRATMLREAPAAGEDAKEDEWESAVQQVLRATFRGEREAVRAALPGLLRLLAPQPLLYVPTARGGQPQRIVQARNLHQVLRGLLAYLPRLGLLKETYRLIRTVQRMERNHPAGPMAVTEFDRLFEIACKGMVQCVVESSDDWREVGEKGPPPRRWVDRTLLALLQQVTATLLRRWLDHSRHVRLSVLEAVADEPRWQTLRRFIEVYGHDLFTQRFMTYGNLRAILHEGAEAYLRSLQEEPEAEERFRLLAELDGPVTREDAARCLELILEATLENYAEYLDYNSTTTQSDRGEMLYTLLDFLRLKASYDRVAWNLQPVVLAHEVLIRCGRTEAAEHWQQAVARESGAVADEHLRRLEVLTTQYGIRLRSVADQLGERLVRPLAVDRLCALVRPAMEELRRGKRSASFARLVRELARFTEEPEGVGLDVPVWLDALENEVRRVRSGAPEGDEPAPVFPAIPQVRLSVHEIKRQLEACENR